jgi:hypothetical protein
LHLKVAPMYGAKYDVVNADVCTVNDVYFNIDKMAMLLNVTTCSLADRPNELAAYISMERLRRIQYLSICIITPNSLVNSFIYLATSFDPKLGSSSCHKKRT